MNDKGFIIDCILIYSESLDNFYFIFDYISFDFYELYWINKNIIYKYYDTLKIYLYTHTIDELKKFKKDIEDEHMLCDTTIINELHKYDYLYDDFYESIYDDNSLYFNTLPREIFRLITMKVNNDISRIIDITTLFNYN